MFLYFYAWLCKTSRPTGDVQHCCLHLPKYNDLCYHCYGVWELRVSIIDLVLKRGQILTTAAHLTSNRPFQDYTYTDY